MTDIRDYLDEIKMLDLVYKEALKERNNLILEAYDEGHSMASIARALGCSRQNIRQVIMRETDSDD